MIRPFEFNAQNGGKLYNERMESAKQSIALLCSFRNSTESESSPFYDFDSLKFTVQDVCNELHAEFYVVGRKLTSHVWMQEIMEVILRSNHVIIDISDPRPNVLYELGILCSLRDTQSVIITLDERVKLDASEVYQLQLLRYSDKDDLRQKLIDVLRKSTLPSPEEEKQLFEQIHRRFSIGALLLLHQMLQSHLSRVDRQDERNPWHTHFPVDNDLKEPSTGNWTLFAHELISEGLARYEYGDFVVEKGISWAIHPTRLGERYLSSEYFLRFFYAKEDISGIKSKL